MIFSSPHWHLPPSLNASDLAGCLAAALSPRPPRSRSAPAASVPRRAPPTDSPCACAPPSSADHGPDCQTIARLNVPFKNPLPDDLPEIEVTDPTHPLFGRRFAMVSRTAALPGPGSVMVHYRHEMLLQIPVAATNLIPVLVRTTTKLTAGAVKELVTLAREYEVLCLSPPPMSGGDSLPHSKRTSARNSSPSSRR